MAITGEGISEDYPGYFSHLPPLATRKKCNNEPNERLNVYLCLLTLCISISCFLFYNFTSFLLRCSHNNMSREIFSVRVASARNLKIRCMLLWRCAVKQIFNSPMNEWSRLDIFVLIGYVFCSIHGIWHLTLLSKKIKL